MRTCPEIDTPPALPCEAKWQKLRVGLNLPHVYAEETGVWQVKFFGAHALARWKCGST